MKTIFYSSIANKFRNNSDLLVALYFLAFFCLGLWIYRDYGFSVDEGLQRNIALKNLEFIAHFFKITSWLDGVEPLARPESVFLGFADRDYGVVFELPAEILIRVFNVQGPNIYYVRHLLTFATFFLATIYFYKTIQLRYKNSALSLLGTTILILSPRIFGDSFFNDKDLVFLSFFVIGTYTLTQLILYPCIKNALYHALACALAIDCRLMGVVLPVFTVGVFALLFIFKEVQRLQVLKIVATYSLALIILIIVFWPWLWANPLEHFITAFKKFAHFRTVPYLHFQGEVISAKNLPWYYIPVWVGITTPVAYLAYFLIGVIFIFQSAIKNQNLFKNQYEDLINLLYLGLTIGPVCMVIVLHSVLYNGWRHLYFIYPSFVLICVAGIYYLLRLMDGKLVFKNIFRTFLICSLLHMGYWMLTWHPYQYLYFNILAGNWAKKYDVDYWAVAYIRPLRKILSQDQDKNYAIYNNMKFDSKGNWILGYPDQTWWQAPYSWSNLLLEQKPITHRSEECSDYIFVPERERRLQAYQNNPHFEKFDEVFVDGHLIYAVYKRRVPLEGGLYNPSIGSEVNFKDRNTRCFLMEGWNESHEDWGVWSVEPGALLWLRPAPGASKIAFDLRAMVHSKHPKQTIQIRVNDGPLQTFTLKSFESNHVVMSISKPNAITPTIHRDEFIKVEFLFPDAIQPSKLGISADSRLLGIGLKKVEFLP